MSFSIALPMNSSVTQIEVRSIENRPVSVITRCDRLCDWNCTWRSPNLSANQSLYQAERPWIQATSLVVSAPRSPKAAKNGSVRCSAPGSSHESPSMNTVTLSASSW
jgi:hypothetical protein